MLEYSHNYSMSLQNLLNYYTDKVNDSAIENSPAGNKTKNDKNNK